MPALFGVSVDSVQSRLLQLAAFNADYYWSVARGKKDVRYTEERYLYFWDDKSICWADKVSKNDTIIPFAAAMEFVLTGKKIWKDAAEIDLGKYKAFVMSGEYIKAGCITLKKPDVERLLAAYNTAKTRPLYYAVHCNAQMAAALLEVGKKLDWKTFLVGTDFYHEKNTVYFKPDYKEGSIGYDADIKYKHPDGNETKVVTVEDCLIGLTNGTISPTVEKQTIKLTLNGKDFVITPGVSIEIKREMTLDSIQVDQLATAWKE